MSLHRTLALLACTSAIGLSAGCAPIGAAGGAIAGITSGAATTNPAVGIGVGIAVQAAIDETLNYYMRGLRQDQQDAIAQLAGNMLVGESMPWRVKHKLPLDNGHGEVRVTRMFDTALAQCKEFVFSLVDGEQPDAKAAWFVATACQQTQGWKWASVEPAVERWGTLQ
ncbi:MAG: hypothetical protein LBE78_03545 [Burkholderiaceae bacterium]|jgi:hypothetical protein|nr:hypothetical protein [Burkholderiaceae bacterium]